jgi:hypothetical protein
MIALLQTIYHLIANNLSVQYLFSETSIYLATDVSHECVHGVLNLYFSVWFELVENSRDD